ncbi:MAG TPA: proline dehydrogenase family protein [Bryobacteraceae bacterium]|nr:proline dehydrogenase family protein [Bryobacteraceae bacterium]
MRALLLFLSRRKGLRSWMETSALARRLAARFVAGDTWADGLEAGRRINREGIAVTFDRLGESVTSLAEAEVSRDEYLRVLAEISDHHLDANVSIKLTQFGMDISEQACRANVEQLVRKARDLNSFVRIDMESSEYTERTLRLVNDMHAQYKTVGTVIQAYLRRSEKDIENLCAQGIRVRLCKGAYLEPAEVAFQAKSDVDRNFVHLMRILLAAGTYPAIATHDEKIIQNAKDFANTRQLSRDSFEFQMLYGIRRDLQRKLVAEGYRLRLYVPFGKAWYPYFMRRLAERPANVLFLARNLLRG